MTFAYAPKPNSRCAIGADGMTDCGEGKMKARKQQAGLWGHEAHGGEREMSSEGMEWNKSALKRRQLAKHHAFSFWSGLRLSPERLHSGPRIPPSSQEKKKKKNPENCQQSIIMWCVCDICCPSPSIPINLLAATAVGLKNAAGAHLFTSQTIDSIKDCHREGLKKKSFRNNVNIFCRTAKGNAGKFIWNVKGIFHSWWATATKILWNLPTLVAHKIWFT